ncbi:hypothetical protein LTR49_024481 [Elasticomyces elasticus]|nr:hypothetical protein LTR49_024481 [Elasticomyces elasticus]
MHEREHHPVIGSLESQGSVVPSVDVPSNAAAVELQGSRLAQEPEEDLLPILDLSDVSIPTPMVPERSLARPGTKSSAIETIQQPPFQQKPAEQQRLAKRSQDVPVMQSTHIPTPNPQHQHHAAQVEPQLQECTAESTTGSSPEELEQIVARTTPRGGSYQAKAQTTVASRTWRSSTLTIDEHRASAA